MTALAELVGMMVETDRLRQDVRAMAVLEERQRLARDLHDSVIQSLYSLSLFSRAGREAAKDVDSARLLASLTELERNTLHALREMRLRLYDLRPADLEQEGLSQAIQLRMNSVERRVGLQLDVELDDLTVISPTLEVQVYQIVVEALNNVVKHAAATRLAMRLTRTGTRTCASPTTAAGSIPPRATAGWGWTTCANVSPGSATSFPLPVSRTAAQGWKP